MRHTFFATCAPGIEPLLHAEVRALRLAKPERQVGGVRFDGTLTDAMRACLWLRTAVRVRMWLARFQAPDGDALYREVGAVDWSRFVEPEGTLVVDALSKDSALTHTQFVEQRTKDAICDQLRARTGRRPSVDKNGPDLRVHVHLFRDRATLAVDCGGESLHKRGWRRSQGRAPLPEPLAAAGVLASEWDGRAPLLDPFCGSGTIAIEAALIAGDVAPGLFRERFGFERWEEHDARRWTRLRDEARARVAHRPKTRILATDVDPERVEDARVNAEAAGVAEQIELAVADARELTPRRGWNATLVTNPPWGSRVGEGDDLVDLYQRFGERLREHCAGYRLALFSGDRRLTRALGLQRLERRAITHGGVALELVLADLWETAPCD